MENTKPGLLTLGQFLRELRDRLRKEFPETYWISGETAGVKFYQNAIYFDLLEMKNGKKVAQMKVSAFIGEGVNAIRTFEKVTGQKLVAGLKIGGRFRVNFHEVSGMSLVLQELDAEMTLGGMELQRKQTLYSLLSRFPQYIKVNDGVYWSANKALRLPLVMQKIAVISSRNAEGYHDFVHTLDHNEYGLKFHAQLYPTTVHGAQAAQDIINAFRSVYESGEMYDAIALIRGGGAPGDFLPYDNEGLGAVIARARFPVITGIGHHNNQSIADMLAAIHEKTPTAAAAYLVERASQFQQRLGQIAFNIQLSARNSVRNRQQQLARYGMLVQLQATNQLKTQRNKVGQMMSRINEAAGRKLQLSRTRIDNLSEMIRNLSPERTLERGFAIIHREGGIITKASELNTGEHVLITFSASKAEAIILKTKITDGE